MAAGLRSAVGMFAEREAEIERVRRSTTYAEKRQLDEAKEQVEVKLERSIVAGKAGLRAVGERVDARFADRIEWISQAYAASRRRLAEEVEALKTRTVTELQMQGLQAKRGGKESIAGAEAEVERLTGEAAELESELGAMERRAKGAMRGHLLMRGKLTPKAGAKLDLPEATGGAAEMLDPAREALGRAGKGLGEFGGFGVPRLLKMVPPVVLIPLAAAGAWAWVHFGPGYEGEAWKTAAGGWLGFSAVLTALSFGGGRGAQPAAGRVAEELEQARRLLAACQEKAAEDFKNEKMRIKSVVADTMGTADDRWSVAEDLAGRRKKAGEQKIEQQIARVTAMNEQNYRRSLEPLEPVFEEKAAALRGLAAAEVAELEAAHAVAQGRIDAEYAGARDAMTADWKATVDPIYAEATAIGEAVAPLSVAWERGLLENWRPGEQFVQAAPFGHLTMDAAGLAAEAGLTLDGAKVCRFRCRCIFRTRAPCCLKPTGRGGTRRWACSTTSCCAC